MLGFEFVQLMDIQLHWFLFMAVAVYMGTEMIKGVVNVYAPDLKIGLLLAMILGVLFTLGLGSGLVAVLAKLEYNKVMIPVLFRIVDILTTGAILSGGSKGLNTFFEKIGVDMAGSIATGLKNLKDKEEA